MSERLEFGVDKEKIREKFKEWLERFRAVYPNFENFQKKTGEYYYIEQKPKDDFREYFEKTVTPCLGGELVDNKEQAEDILLKINNALKKNISGSGKKHYIISPSYASHIEKLKDDSSINSVRAFQILHSKSIKEHPKAIVDFSHSYINVLKNEGIYGTKSSAHPNLWSKYFGFLILAIKNPCDAMMFGSNLWMWISQELFRDTQSVFEQGKNKFIQPEQYKKSIDIAKAVFKKLHSENLKPKDLWDVYNFFRIAVDKHYMKDLDANCKEITEGNTKTQEREPTTNLILYGPPGTGKTYRTAKEAVRLCEGVEPPADREKLMQQYKDLLDDGRIEFVTFHQSFSYEEFVEGLRPYTGEADDDDTEETVSTGFSLSPTDGVFKRISERARLDDKGINKGQGRLDRNKSIFKITVGGDKSADQLLKMIEANEIRIDYGGEVDWSEDRFDDYDAIHDRWKEKVKNPNVSGHDSNVSVTRVFRCKMKVGDYVIIPSKGGRIRAFGCVKSDYQFDDSVEHYRHYRKVQWIWRDDDGADVSEFYSNIIRRYAACKLRGDSVDWDGLEKIILGEEKIKSFTGARNHVLIIDEINRTNVSKVFGELITLLEPDKRLGAENEIRIRLPYSKKLFGMPSNLHIIGTMNTADRSIALIDTALRRRFDFQEILPDPSKLRTDVDGINLELILKTINERIEYLYDRDHQIGHAYFMSCATRSDVDRVMHRKVIPLLAEYFFEDWDKIAAVLGDMESHEKEIKGSFLNRSVLPPPPGLDNDEAVPRFRWDVRSVDKGFDYTKLLSS